MSGMTIDGGKNDMLKDIENTEQKDEDLYFKQMVEREKRNTMSMSVSIKRNTAIDRVIERKCY